MKINVLLIIFFLIILSACSSTKYNMLDGKSKPVYFTPDSTVYDAETTEKYNIGYSDLRNTTMNFVNVIDLEKNKTATAIILGPTFFTLKGGGAYVYPGEEIIVSKGQYNDFVMRDKNGDVTRNNELLFIKKFSEISYYPQLVNYPSTPIDSVLQLEKQWCAEIPFVKAREQKKFDSLAIALQVSEKFKKLTKNYLFGRYEVAMIDFYKIYKDSLSAHGLYKPKMREAMKFFNNISNPDLFNHWAMLIFNENAQDLFSVKIRRIETPAQFSHIFDTTLKVFNGVAADLMLTQLMYQSYKMDVPFNDEYVKKYYSIVKVKEYKDLIKRMQKQWNANKSEGTAKNDMLLLQDGKKKISFDNVIRRYKGKVIVLDFWAHWCAPCRDEVPAFKQLIENYKDSSIVFIRISIDREIQPWRKTIISDGIDSKNEFLFLHYKEADFLKAQKVETIPRYMLIDRNGNLVNADLPRPGEEGMVKIINESLRK